MKPKCPKCGHPLDSYATWRREVESHPFGVACSKCKWVRMVSRAAIIRLATAKPETCKWWHRPAAYVWTSCCGSYPEATKYCPDCGKPLPDPRAQPAVYPGSRAMSGPASGYTVNQSSWNFLGTSGSTSTGMRLARWPFAMGGRSASPTLCVTSISVHLRSPGRSPLARLSTKA